MEAQKWRGISIKWSRPATPDFVVALTLGYLLYQQPSVPDWGTVYAMITALRCIHVTRTV
ncbi:hypothetical protein ABT169_20785 [Streptomyces sp. NPDC001616]|uniref:hypothetical protein n=1 Tax=Streptomyces sp. NPDC001616 TaxID=3156648 RepID=UPI0033210AD4